MFEYKLHIKDNVKILSVKGRIDSSTAEEFKKAIEEATKEEGNYMLVVDAKELTYISSAGLRVIISTQKKLGSKFVILNASLAVKKVIEVAEIPNILHYLEIEEKECDKYIDAIYNRYKDIKV